MSQRGRFEQERTSEQRVCVCGTGGWGEQASRVAREYMATSCMRLRLSGRRVRGGAAAVGGRRLPLPAHTHVCLLVNDAIDQRCRHVCVDAVVGIGV